MSRIPYFSVIIPTYQRPHLLIEAVDSVLSQSVGDLECIVVDDGGGLRSEELPSDTRIRTVRRSARGGPAVARNSGLDVAHGRFVSFLDDDDLYGPDRLEIAIEGLKIAPVAVCWGSELGNSGHRKAGRMLEGIVKDSILDDLVPHLNGTAVDRAMVPRFRPDLEACEDVEWWLRLAHDAPVATVPRIGYYSRPHDGTDRRTIGFSQRVNARKILLTDYAEYFDAHRRAAAFAWKRIGLMTRGNHAGEARRALTRSFRLRPSPRTLWHLLRCITAVPWSRLAATEATSRVGRSH